MIWPRPTLQFSSRIDESWSFLFFFESFYDRSSETYISLFESVIPYIDCFHIVINFIIAYIVADQKELIVSQRKHFLSRALLAKGFLSGEIWRHCYRLSRSLHAGTRDFWTMIQWKESTEPTERLEKSQQHLHVPQTIKCSPSGLLLWKSDTMSA